LIIIREDKVESTLLGVGGLAYVLAKFNQTKENPPTAENLQLVKSILQAAGQCDVPSPSRVAVVGELYESAILWRNTDLWKQIATLYADQFWPTSSWSTLPGAVKTFGFEALRGT